MFGPNVTIATAGHPILPELRQKGLQYNMQVHIGKNCWIGAGAIIMPGVTIGDNVVIGAGSVVTKNVPDFTVVAGNPARIVRKIETQMDPTQSGAEWSGWPEERAEGAEGEDVPTSKMPEADIASKRDVTY